MASLRQQGQGIRAIAHVLGRSPFAISRELRRNACDSLYSLPELEPRLFSFNALMGA